MNVSQTGGAVSSPSDLHDKLSDLADKKGGAYYRIVAAKQIGPNFQAFADVYKDAFRNKTTCGWFFCFRRADRIPPQPGDFRRRKSDRSDIYR